MGDDHREGLRILFGKPVFIPVAFVNQGSISVEYAVSIKQMKNFLERPCSPLKNLFSLSLAEKVVCSE